MFTSSYFISKAKLVNHLVSFCCRYTKFEQLDEMEVYTALSGNIGTERQFPPNLESETQTAHTDPKMNFGIIALWLI